MSEVKLSTAILVCAVVGMATYVITKGGGSAENVWRKAKMLYFGAVHMLVSIDKRFKPEVRERYQSLGASLLVCLCRVQ